MTDRVLRRRQDMPSKYHKLYDKAVAGKASPRQAIKMHCLECWAYVSEEARTCDNIACPLHAYRPAKSATRAVQGATVGVEGDIDES